MADKMTALEEEVLTTNRIKIPMYNLGKTVEAHVILNHEFVWEIRDEIWTVRVVADTLGSAVNLFRRRYERKSLAENGK